MLDWVGETIERILAWFKEFFQWLFDWAWSRLLDALAYAIELIPVPDAFAEVDAAYQGVISAAGFFLGPFEVGFGLTLYFSALGARFLLRRTPLVG